MFSGRQNAILDSEDLLGNTRTFPLASKPGGAREIGRAEEEQLDAVDAQHLGDVAPAADGFDDRYDQDVVVRFVRVLRHTLAPAGRALCADSPNPFEWI